MNMTCVRKLGISIPMNPGPAPSQFRIKENNMAKNCIQVSNKKIPRMHPDAFDSASAPERIATMMEEINALNTVQW